LESMKVSSRLTISLVLALITLTAFWPVLHAGFLNYDDDEYVTDNPQVPAGLTIEGAKWAFTTPHSMNWHPLTWLSHMADVELFGLNPRGHHLINLLFHAANTVLLFLLLVRMTGSVWRSGFVAALFGMHPLHVESVAWVSERKDVLSTLFWILATWAYIRYAEVPRLRRYIPVFLLMALGLLSKPMLVTLPFVFLLLDYWPLQRLSFGKKDTGKPSLPLWKLVVEKTPLFAMAAASSAVTYIVQQKGGAVSSFEAVPFGARVANALVAYVGYIGKMVWPAKLAVLYPHPGTTLPVWKAVAAGVVLALITFLAVVPARRRRYMAVGWLWYLGTLVPMIGLVQVGGQAMADRYTYVPLIGLFVMIAWGMNDGATRRQGDKATPTPPYPHTPILTALALIVLGALMAKTWVQAGYWRDSITLFRHTIAVTGPNYVAHYNLGCALVAHYNLGCALGEKGRLEEAVEHYRESIRVTPGYPRAHYNLAGTLRDQGKLDEAAAEYREAIRLDPEYAEAYHNLGNLLDDQKKGDEALAMYLEAVRLNPTLAEVHNNLAIKYYFEGEYVKAWEEVRLTRKYGVEPHAEFIEALSGKMPEP